MRTQSSAPLRLALPRRYRELIEPPPGTSVKWYSGAQDAQTAAVDAEVFWMDILPTQTTRAVIQAAARLRWFADNQVGVDGWPLDLMGERGFQATNGSASVLSQSRRRRSRACSPPRRASANTFARRTDMNGSVRTREPVS